MYGFPSGMSPDALLLIVCQRHREIRDELEWARRAQRMEPARRLRLGFIVFGLIDLVKWMLKSIAGPCRTTVPPKGPS